MNVGNMMDAPAVLLKIVDGENGTQSHDIISGMGVIRVRASDAASF
jgi:hypothetical protein